MRQYSRWLSALVLLLASVPALTQDHIPKLIDVHIHYDGEPGILEKLLDKLDAADGLAFLLTTPAGFPQASKLIHEHPNRFIGFGDIKLDDPNVLQGIDRFHAAGFRGLGEISVGFSPVWRAVCKRIPAPDGGHVYIVFSKPEGTDGSCMQLAITNVGLIDRYQGG